MPNTVIITYFVHGTTTDNQDGIATGWNQGELSELGKTQSIQLKERVRHEEYDVVFCSDLKRAVDSAKITFEEREIPIIKDKRLRECNYGNLNGADSHEVESIEVKSIRQQYPNGESYKEVENRMRRFLKYLLEKYPGKHIAIVAHKAPQLALEVITNKKTWQQAFEQDWRKKEPKEWKPGWVYILKEGMV
ncbi:histidine phosphatase family protein [Candidatus Woesearchaeota archaeon]|nr:histidine phosphatase family protein [Candidatus Woesearchaeota archaeon]